MSSLNGAPIVITEPLGGAALARAAVAGTTPEGWYPPIPSGREAWRAHASRVASGTPGGWLEALAPALGDGATAASDRLARVAREGGIVVTTGQQPGLFGGPVYTWSKAISALALADALERATGVAAAPVFWAATDDADLEEASTTWVATRDGAELLRMRADAEEGTPMSAVPLPPLEHELDALARGAGSVANAYPLDVVRRAYQAGATVGGAYLALLRAMLEPIGIAVLDAAHASVRACAEPTLRRALGQARDVERALAVRDAELTAAGHEPQVQQVPGRSLVFAWEDGRKRRLAIGEEPSGASLSPNVLLRPVVERMMLPTVGYLAGPGELAYFAQVSAVADALRCPRPLALPRWSGTILEPHVQRILARLGIERDELARAGAAERRLAGAAMPPALRDALAEWTRAAGDGARAVSAAADGLLAPRTTDGAAAWMAHRVARVERRALAALVRRDTATARDLVTARGSLYPGGSRQERALNLVPLMARHGAPLLEGMLGGARAHAEALVGA